MRAVVDEPTVSFFCFRNVVGLTLGDDSLATGTATLPKIFHDF